MSTSFDMAVAESEKAPAAGGRAAKPAGVLSPTALSLHVAGWLMLACFFLPISRGCNGAIVRPVNCLAISPPVQASHIIGSAIALSVYGNALATALLITISGLTRSPVFWWRTFVVQFAITFSAMLAMMCSIMFDATSLRGWLVNTFEFLPAFVGGTTWVALAMRRGERELAWARLHHLWTVAGWVVLHLQCIFSNRLLYGYWMTLGALAAQFFAVELARHRMQHDLWDRSQPVRRPQISLRTIFLWMTVLPLIPAYFQALQALIGWWFGE